MKNKVRDTEKNSLAKQIQRKISVRILSCTLLLLIVSSILIFFDIYTSIAALNKSLNTISKNLGAYVVSQELVDNQQAINPKLKEIGEQNHAHISWVQNQQAKNILKWQPPFGWVYTHNLSFLSAQEFGYLKITGSFFYPPFDASQLLIRTSILLFSFFLIFVLLYPLSSRIPKFLFVDPINNLLHLTAKRTKTPLKYSVPIELQELEAKILDLLRQAKITERHKALVELEKISAQVAHDIRSPLSVLQVLVDQQLAEIGESKRVLLREAISQIRDITNNLEKDTLHKEKSITQVAILLEHVISERRVALANQTISINQNISPEAYDLFANVIPSEMKRVLSNIINNACEAIKTDNGSIQVDLTTRDKNLLIKVTDNGVGIGKEKVSALFERGYTTKVNGTGLGLFHAKECLAKLGGAIHIHSDVGQGTTVTITLPAEPPPSWYIGRLVVLANSTLICVDDSISIFHAWQERLKSEPNNIDLRYCGSEEDLKSELDRQKEKDKPCTYLVDYEFSGQAYTGLDLIEVILSLKTPSDRVFLVTSRSSEVELQKFCSAKNIFMIPKFFALKIPFQIVESIS